MAKLVLRVVIFVGTIILTLVAYYFSLNDPVFHDPYSTVLEDRHHNLLSASIASDGQWRFPALKEIPDKFRQAIILYEDKRFENHPGVDLMAMARAIRQNFHAGKVVSGGSTISMQVIRLSRRGKARTFFEKSIEIILATRLEWRYSKEEVLQLYTSHAPFGGNVVGIEAACWRYFGRDAQNLNWAEAALLAVLPNNPALLHPGKHRDELKQKRDRLLDRLFVEGRMNKLSLDLAKTEPLPENPHPLPRLAHHLLVRIGQEGYKQSRLASSLDIGLQRRTEEMVSNHHLKLKGNQIFNAGVVVMEVKTGRVLAYVGNTEAGVAYQDNVDMITSRRSTGSILKPFLFAAMLDEGKMLRRTLFPDIPVTLNGFSPRNFSHEFDGAVPADQALIRSLNIPAIYELRSYRYEKFHSLLMNLGITTLNHPPDHYGLSLILGGAEGTLWDITGAYASMARTLNNYFTHPGKNRYDRHDFHPPVYTLDESPGETPTLEQNSWINAASIWQTFETLKDLYRPGEQAGWRYFNSSKPIAWKTGTSFGFRDGWAVGVNPEYAVGVWVGNADGEGRPGLMGTEAAAPLLFDVFGVLPGQPWFQQPLSEMEKIVVCKQSGQRATDRCHPSDTVWVTRQGLQTSACSFHQVIHLSPDKKFRVNSACERVDQMTNVCWFVLPPVQEFYFKTKHISYLSLPPFRKDCDNPVSTASLDLIYPQPRARILIPRELNGEMGSTVFEATHRQPTITVYWHLDGSYLGSTRKVHHFALAPSEGKHTITLIDEAGETVERNFTIISQK